MSTTPLQLIGLARRDVTSAAGGVSVVRTALVRRMARVGLAMLASLLLAMLAVTMFSTQDVFAPSGAQLRGPSTNHLLGTDQLGRDVLVRVAAGGWRSLGGALLALTTAVSAGIAVGVAAAVAGRRVDQVLMRAVDAVNGIPPLIIPIAIVGALGPSYPNLLLAIVISYVPSYARIARTFAAGLDGRLDIVSARLLGISRRRIAATHVLPAVFAQMLVIATLDVGSVIVALSGLSFLGLGAQAPTPEWGVLLSDGQMFYSVAPWLLLAPATAITVIIIASNLIGESLRDALAERSTP